VESLYRFNGSEFVTLAPAWILLAWCLAAPQPSPSLSPGDVVQTVLAALRNRNQPIPNAGVFTTYVFASPSNHAATGPYGHFMGLVKDPDFAPLLHDHATTVGKMEIANEHAAQTVTVHLQAGRDQAFRFTLSRQKAGRYLGCWMVDGVTPATLDK
jgi:hypothetical protein